MSLSKPVSIMSLSNEIIIEIIIEIIARAKFSPEGLQNLRDVHKRFDAIITEYEKSIAKDILNQRQFQDAKNDFPGLQTDRSMNYRMLSEFTRRYDTIYTITHELLKECDYGSTLMLHNISLVEVGLMLLYRMHDLDTYLPRVHLLTALPLQPLVAIRLVLYHCTYAARRVGESLISRNYYHHDAATRSDIELCFAELILTKGPEFILNILRYNLSTGERPLISYLNASLAEKMLCEQRYALMEILHMVKEPKHRLADLEFGDRAKLVRGHSLD
ncbi:hypothetical protein K432DRAFT_420960 [Lepidopterella palustris CBS 459.81]|uniref:F-box domain-containing protein n=1 Tax=Lepidopterella palustris CBS 459.81 TaxID=1314670 RepID=A0A8E2ELW7_9PEZI|nr:hypothetical protein K432DRAFT_420960 [Lepidopterella palustris CBS 459.81]